ncbi:MAG: hypothetical protein QOF35_2008 [Actinomycetota bacterium]|nr:hypothetical protein [Actinomycetota bacterium]
MDSVRGDRQRIAHTLALEEGQLFDLHRHPQRAQNRSDEHRTGMDHIAFAGADRAGLLRLAARLNWLGILRRRNRGRPLRLWSLFTRPRRDCARVLLAA